MDEHALLQRCLNNVSRRLESECRTRMIEPMRRGGLDLEDEERKTIESVTLKSVMTGAVAGFATLALLTRGRRWSSAARTQSQFISAPLSPARAVNTFRGATGASGANGSASTTTPLLSYARMIGAGLASGLAFYGGALVGAFWGISVAVPKLIEQPDAVVGDCICSSLAELDPCMADASCAALLHKSAMSALVLEYVIKCRARGGHGEKTASLPFGDDTESFVEDATPSFTDTHPYDRDDQE